MLFNNDFFEKLEYNLVFPLNIPCIPDFCAIHSFVDAFVEGEESCTNKLRLNPNRKLRALNFVTSPSLQACVIGSCERLLSLSLAEKRENEWAPGTLLPISFACGQVGKSFSSNN